MPPTILDDARNGSIDGDIRWNGRDLPREWFHEEWLRRAEDWRLFYICYKGGREFLESKSPVTLFSHERESATSYADRLKRASYRNHCETIIALKAAAIYQPQVLRNQAKTAPKSETPREADPPLITRAQAGDPTFEPFTRDVDLIGTNADPWWAETASWAMTYGCEWAGIAMSSAPEIAARARAEGRGLTEDEAQTAGVRPYYYRAPPLSVIDWDRDDHGRLKHVVMLATEMPRSPLAKRGRSPSKPRLIARVLYPTHEERFEIGERNGQTLIGDFPHPFGEVPLVPVTIRPDGRSQIEDIARLNIEVYNNDSQANEQICRQTFNQLVGKVKDAASFQDNVTGTESLMTIAVDESLEYLAPNVQTITTIDARSWERIDEMYAMANLRSRPGGKGSQPATETSGVAYAFEHQNAETDLASIASRLEEAELKLGAMRERALGLGAGGFSCQYPRSFDVRALLTRAAEAQQLKAAGLGPQAIGEVLKNVVRQALPRLSAPRLAEIYLEIDERAKLQAEVDVAAAEEATTPEADPDAPDGRANNRPPDQGLMAPGKGAGADRHTRAAMAVGSDVEVD